MSREPPHAEDDEIGVLIVGAGISGIGMAIALKQHRWNSFMLIDAAEDLGGTWRDNTYPGVAVDIPSSSFCFSFEPNYHWSRVFAPGYEVQNYIRHCSDIYGITPHIRFGQRVAQARFDTKANHWRVSLDSGAVLSARFLIAATGLFTTPIKPEIPGLDLFAGKQMHSARWDHSYDFNQKRVAVIGTGASATQIVPELAKKAASVTVFQRTPIYIAPRFDRALHRHTGALSRPSRIAGRMLSGAGISTLSYLAVNHRRHPFVTHVLQYMIRGWMRRQVHDATIAEKLVPTYDLGCKRPTTSNTYLQSFNLSQVALVTDPIVEITRDGAKCASSAYHHFDALVLATGFQTTEKGNAPAFEIIGEEGQELGEFWSKQRRQAYAGIAVAGFPNFFLTSGPYSGGLNWFEMVETHVSQIMQCLEKARLAQASRITIDKFAYRRDVQQTWQETKNTVFASGDCAAAHSYYIDKSGDASLPSPRTPAWRRRQAVRNGARDFRVNHWPE